VINAQFRLDRRFRKTLSGRFERFDIQVGILEDKPHKTPRSPRSIGSLQGGPVRKVSARTNGMVSQVSERMRKRYDFYRKPFKKKSPDVRKFVRAFFELATGKTKSYGKTRTALRAVIRNPILKGAYGKNRMRTRLKKGFNRLMIDTGQMFKGINARIRSRRGKK
jgi:hypothetical protein